MGRLCAERVALYGGAALVLDFNYRQMTRDIDFGALHVEAGMSVLSQIRALACEAETRLRLSGRGGCGDVEVHTDLMDMNEVFRDDVSIFRSCEAEHIEHGNHGGDKGRFRVLKASPRYILAMKALSMRNALESYDTLDVWELMKACSIKSAEEVQVWWRILIPDKRFQRKTRI